MRKAHLAFFDGLYDASVNVPRRELFMYSDGDRLVWRSHVEQFVARRRDQGSIVETRNSGARHTSAISARTPKPIARPSPSGSRP